MKPANPFVHTAAFPLAMVIGMLSGAGPGHAATLHGRVTIAGQPAVHAVVYLESTGTPATPAPGTPVIMDQKNLAFVPEVLPVMRGTIVEFTNSDDVQHNVFSPSAIADKFNLGTYGPGATRTVTLDRSGEVLVLCNIHMEMEAHILVLNGPYFAATGPGGSYRIGEVPAGTYTAKIWQDGWLPFMQSVEVPAAGELALDLATPK